jgi:tight adherence protein C
MNLGVMLMGATASAGMLMILAFFLSVGDRRGGEYAERMAEVEDHRLVTSLTELEMSRPLRERVFLPLWNTLASAVARRTPASQERRLRLLVLSAGRPNGVNVTTVMVAKAIAAAASGGLAAFLLLPFMKVPFPLNLLGLAAALLGWILPDQWLKQNAGARRTLLERAIPDTLDLLTICLDAGLAFDAAVNELSQKIPGPMGQELTATMTEIRLGRSRTDALQEMAERVQVEDWTDFTQAIITSRKIGSPISEMVSVQSAEIRRRRRQRSEEKAAQASLKMMFPMIGCIFPTLFIVLMGPVALLLMHPNK